jgi:hypothetical protein
MERDVGREWCEGGGVGEWARIGIAREGEDKV